MPGEYLIDTYQINYTYFVRTRIFMVDTNGRVTKMTSIMNADLFTHNLCSAMMRMPEECWST